MKNRNDLDKWVRALPDNSVDNYERKSGDDKLASS